MELNRICKALKAFYVIGIVIFCTFFVSFIFNFEVCYNFLTGTLLEELSFKYFFKFDGFFSINDIGGDHLINTIIFVVGVPIGDLLYDCFLEKKVNPNGANTFGADIVLASVIFYFPFKVFLLGFAHALVVLATDAGVLVLFLWFILICIGYSVLYYKLKDVANELVFSHLGKVFSCENCNIYCPEFAKFILQMHLMVVELIVICLMFLVLILL